MYIYIYNRTEKKENLFFLSSPVMRNSKRGENQARENTHTHTPKNFRVSLDRYCYESKTWFVF
jgi:hypothetical protein